MFTGNGAGKGQFCGSEWTGTPPVVGKRGFQCGGWRRPGTGGGGHRLDNSEGSAGNPGNRSVPMPSADGRRNPRPVRGPAGRAAVDVTGAACCDCNTTGAQCHVLCVTGFEVICWGGGGAVTMERLSHCHTRYTCRGVIAAFCPRGALCPRQRRAREEGGGAQKSGGPQRTRTWNFAQETEAKIPQPHSPCPCGPFPRRGP